MCFKLFDQTNFLAEIVSRMQWRTQELSLRGIEVGLAYRETGKFSSRTQLNMTVIKNMGYLQLNLS